jgi:phenylacetate-coenzyme A ligase PaaK-like adenylate-forming protein
VLQRFPIREGEACWRAASTKHQSIALRHPGRTPLRTAVLDPRIRTAGDVRFYSIWQDPALAAWEPESIAAPLEILLAMARQTGRPPVLQHSVVAFTSLAGPELTAADVRLLWRAFQVPVFQQLRAPDGQLLASECEAHTGLHIADTAYCEFRPCTQGPELIISYVDAAGLPALRLATGLTARTDNGPCACGSSIPRLAGLKRMTTCLEGRAAGAA